jgi:hypothetical protein
MSQSLLLHSFFFILFCLLSFPSDSQSLSVSHSRPTDSSSVLFNNVNSARDLLFSFVQNSQTKRDEAFQTPFVSPEKFSGLFPSFVQLNLYGSWYMELGRNTFKVYDNNGFVSFFVAHALLEAKQYESFS